MGTLDKFFASGGGGLSNEQRFTSSGTFTVPSGVYVVFVSGCGAGAGGISGKTSAGLARAANGAGGGACALFVPVPVQPSEVITVTVGAAGIGGVAIQGQSTSEVSGTNGGDSKFKYLTLGGGTTDRTGGGLQYPLGMNDASVVASGASGSASASYSAVTGTRYQSVSISPEFPAALSGQAINNLADGAGGGGSSFFGKGGSGGDPRENAAGYRGQDATGYGAGGGAGGSVYNAAGARKAGDGGNGSGGLIIVNW